MSTRKNVRKFWSLVLFVAAFGIVIAAAGNISIRSDQASNPKDSTTKTAEQPKIVTPAQQPTTTPSPAEQTVSTEEYDLIVLVQGGTKNSLVRLNPVTKKRTTIFTDADEDLKIKQVGNSTNNGKEIIVLMGNPQDDFSGNLYTIATDGSGEKQLLIENFASPWPPAISPDGKKIAYVFFSNAERDGGFTLMLADRDGKNAQELFRDDRPITQPIFSPDGTEIAYVRETPPRGAAIFAITPATKKTREIATFSDRVPYDLAWTKDNTFAFIDGVGDQANLFYVSKASNQPVKISTPNGQVSHPQYSPTGENLAFSINGTVYILNQASDRAQQLGSGTIVVGWVATKE